MPEPCGRLENRNNADNQGRRARDNRYGDGSIFIHNDAQQ